MFRFVYLIDLSLIKKDMIEDKEQEKMISAKKLNNENNEEAIS